MRKLWSGLSLGFVLSALVLTLAMTVASANHGELGTNEGNFPAQNANACAAHGGTFTQVNNPYGPGSGVLKTCVVDEGTVTTTVVTKAAGKSGKGWTVESTWQITVTYTMHNGTQSTSVSTQSVGSPVCRNPGGQIVDDPDNPHCNP